MQTKEARQIVKLGSGKSKILANLKASSLLVTSQVENLQGSACKIQVFGKPLHTPLQTEGQRKCVCRLLLFGVIILLQDEQARVVYMFVCSFLSVEGNR